ncbi:hypothetical protein AX16_006674 [Volvariella volvacea WC 439]|nr:hypothetical protein AX16_006674 [Volvariella volvacea WC 439]
MISLLFLYSSMVCGNRFFLFIAILQFLPWFSTISPAVAILPLIIILAVTALKDGYEDWKRHQSDKRVNHSVTQTLRGPAWKNPNAMKSKSKTFVRGLIPGNRGRTSTKSVESDIEGLQWEQTLWEDIRVGDIVKIMDNEAIPADILICSTSEENDVAFVETKNLDGETNLKSRNAVSALTHLKDRKDFAKKENAFSVNCDRPDTDMYRFNGTVTIHGEVSPVDISMMLLRGTVLRNTSWVIGVVLLTGLDTKIVMNSAVTPSKRSKVERQMNPQVFLNLGLLAVMATACAIADALLEQRYYPLGAPWLFGADRNDDNPRINGLITFVYSLLTFQIVVPISLYISLEFVRTCQALFIYLDGDIYYEKADQPTIARTWNLSDDLGQIEYIFSDKTGTLTQNSMVFRQCSIGGKMYKGETTYASTLPGTYTKSPLSSTTDNNLEAGYEPPTPQLQPSSSSSQVEPLTPGWSVRPPTSMITGVRDEIKPEESISTDGKEKKEEVFRFSDTMLQHDLVQATLAEPGSEAAHHARALNGFFTVLALCHTVLTSVNQETGELTYKSQSPDEAALVQAAADVGFVFRGREKEILTMTTPFTEEGEVERYELLNILEFSSARKRMSVIVRKLDGDDRRIMLLSKGADNVIFARLKDGQDTFKALTDQHLSEFARSGLRTLTLAYRVLSEEEYASWGQRYYNATISMDDREGQVEAVSSEIEQNLRLLGATAIEDRLQDGVPETIADLLLAGIKLWVLTGDKMETAIAIGRSTNLISPESNIIVLRGNPDGKSVADQMTDALDIIDPSSTFQQQQQQAARRSRTSLVNGLASRVGGGEQDYALRRINTGVSSLVGDGNGERPGGFVLVVDGAALAEAFENDESKHALLVLGMQCDAVICCRVSPLQKALVVKLVKDGLDSICLAIGDGANDVSMIQAADVGVGISGEEGLQAVNSSDYAIAQFRYLKKLVLVHGHWSYARNGVMILNFFYKNIVPVGVLFWFQIHDAWSANYVFDYIYILFWNSIWTVAPVVGIGLFDRFLDSSVLMKFPELYHYGRTGSWFGIKPFAVYMFDGVVQSAIIYFLILYTYWTTSSRTDGFAVSQYEFSTTMAITAVVVADIFTGLNSTAWSAWIFFAVFIGIIVVWVFTAIYSAISPGYAVTFLFGTNFFLWRSAYFWLCFLLTFTLSLTPRYLYKAWRTSFAPTDIEMVRYLHKQVGDAGLDDLRMNKRPTRPTLSRNASASSFSASRSRVSLAQAQNSRPQSQVGQFSASQQQLQGLNPMMMASTTDMSTGLPHPERGFGFSMEENGVALQRMQTHLSERHASQQNLPRRGATGKTSMFSLRKLKHMSSLHRKAS